MGKYRTGKMKQSLINVVLGVIVLTYASCSLFPILWMIKLSLTKYLLSAEFVISFEHYKLLFTDSQFLNSIKNSLIVSNSAAFLSIMIGLLAAYSLDRFNFKGKDNIEFFILSNRFLPLVIIIVPVFLIASKLKLVDNVWTLMLLYAVLNLPFTIWVLWGYIHEIPKEIGEAAMIDGCSTVAVIRKVIFPLSLPGISAMFILCYIFNWSEYLCALTLTGLRSQTLPIYIAIYEAPREVQWGPLTAAGTISILPILILALLGRKYLVRGLIRGALR